MTPSATKRVAYNTAVQIAGKAVIIVIAAISVAILTRYLGAEGYGKFTLVLVYLQIFGLVADMGLFTIAVREMSKDESRIQEIVSNTLSLRALLSVGVFAVAMLIAFILPYEPDVRIGIAIAAFSHFFGLMNSSLLTVFQTKLRMEFSVVADIVGRLVSFGATLLVAYLDLGFYAVVGTAAIGSAVTFAVTALLSRRYVKLTFYRDVALWKALLKESIPLGAALVVGQLYFRLDVLMLSVLRSTAEVGVYGAVFKILEMILTLPGFFMNSVFPVLVRRLQSGSERVKETMQKAFDALLVFGFGFSFGGLASATEIMRILGGDEFVTGDNALRISLFAMALTFLILMLASFYIAQGKQVFALKVSTFGLILNALLNLYFIPHFGIVGASITTLISEAALLTVLLLKARSMLGQSLSLRVLPRVLLAGGVMAAAMWPFQGLLVIALPVGVIVYGLALLVLRVVSRDILRELNPR